MTRSIRIGSGGIGAGDRVVIYDHGTLFGARLWWVLDQLGHAVEQKHHPAAAKRDGWLRFRHGYEPLLAQSAYEVRAFVGGDSAGHSEQYAFALH